MSTFGEKIKLFNVVIINLVILTFSGCQFDITVTSSSMDQLLNDPSLINDPSSDKMGPLPPIITFMGPIPNTLTETPTLHFSSGVDAGSGWSHDEVRLLKLIDDSEVVGWSSFVSGSALTALSLIPGESYYYELRSVDLLGNVSTITVSASWISQSGLFIDSLDPNLTAILSSLPMEIDSTETLNVVVGSISATHYKYKVGQSSAINCSHSSGYSAGDIILGTPIAADLSSFADGTMLTLCVRGGQSGIAYQSPTISSSYSWIKDTVVQANISNLGQVLVDSSSTQNVRFVLDQAKPYDVTLNYSVSGTANASDHDLTPGSVLIPAGQISASVNYHLLRNAATNPEKSFNIFITRSSRPGVVPGELAYQSNVIRDADSGSYQRVIKLSDNAFSHMCAILSNNTLYCWGRNYYSTVGDGTGGGGNEYRPSPVLVDSGTSYASVSSSGNSHTCAITTTGVLKCWGLNSFGSAGDGTIASIASPKIIDSNTSYLQVSTGEGNSSCGITTDHKLKCWGSNGSYKLGDGTTTERRSPILIDEQTSYKYVSTGRDHTCAITMAGILKCWGSNSYGQLGDGTTTTQPTPTIIDSTQTYKQISAASYYTCGITEAHVLKCWGSHASGKLGLGDITAKVLTPTIVDPGVSYKQISMSPNITTTCGLTEDNILKCWGDGQFGQLRILPSYEASHNRPIVVDADNTFEQVSVGSGFICAIVAVSGALKCWGSNSNGALGDDFAFVRTLPTVVDSHTQYTSVSGTCGFTTVGETKCWGFSSNGFLGLGSALRRSIPTVLPHLDGQTRKEMIRAWRHSCSIQVNGALQCWGPNNYGELGDGTNQAKVSPALIDYGVTYSQVAVGSYHTCGLTSTGILKCWGGNDRGQLGDGQISTKRSLPAIVDPGVIYKKIALGGKTTCGITSEDTLKCWGSLVGDGTAGDRNTPTLIDPGVAYAEISTGGTHTCGITTTGLLKCWGYNNYRALGDGTSLQRLSPTPIDSAETYSKISVGYYYNTCGITTAGVLKCWGSNSSGQVGNGVMDSNFISTPLVIDPGTPYSQVSVGVEISYRSTCGITTSGVLKCWGGHGRIENLGLEDISPPWIPRFVSSLTEPQTP